MGKIKYGMLLSGVSCAVLFSILVSIIQAFFGTSEIKACICALFIIVPWAIGVFLDTINKGKSK